MTSPNHTISVFSVKFNDNNDSFEIIPEYESESKPSGFQNEFYNSVVGNKKPENELSCAKCGRKYKYIAMLSAHQRTCEGPKETLHHCPSCSRNYKSTKAFKKHVLHCFQTNSTPCLADRTLCFCCAEPIQNAHVGQIPCLFCPKEFKTQKGLTRHIMLLHATTAKFKCELCNAQCSNNYILKLHRESHNEEIDRLERDCPEYKCIKCHKVFLDKTAFEIHLKNHERKDITPGISYKCKVCHTNLATVDALISHICEDLKRAKYHCKLCGKILSSKGFFQRHINTHKKYNELAKSDIGAMATTSSDMDWNADVKIEISDTVVADEGIVLSENKIKAKTIEKSPTNPKEPRILNGESLFQSVSCDEVAIKNETETEFNMQTILKSIKKNKITDIDFFPMDTATLKESVACFLQMLLDAGMLKTFGWPHTPIEKVIVEILKHLQCNPSSNREDVAMQLRENTKLLIEAVVDNACEIIDFDDLHVIDLVLREIIKYGMKEDTRN